MKKQFSILIVFIIVSISLIACSDDEGDTTDQSNTPSNEQEEATETNSSEKSNDTEGKWGKDYLELGIGDTGIVHNNHSKFEVTLNSVEITEKKGDHTSETGVFVIPNITVKNIGDDTIIGDDILSSTALTYEPGTSGYTVVYLDGIFNGWPAEIKPQESKSVDVVFDEIKNDVYALQFGHALESVSNEVRFTFNRDEAKK
ncbi:DUF4352 domain-containing protein [Virgibacillus ndiopensis]|uniref:DUF4352 domain-containing protein n=1 Tax=Virgibacillus ndiopensis TaxID=2004408 RepID=UPI000C06B027|nr:DUF4352 domain-containing protein [Virgibacillus ndiopensis]